MSARVCPKCNGDLIKEAADNFAVESLIYEGFFRSLKATYPLGVSLQQMSDAAVLGMLAQRVDEMRKSLVNAMHASLRYAEERDEASKETHVQYVTIEQQAEEISRLSARVAELERQLADPIQTRPGGRTVVFTDELPAEDRAYLHGYRRLTQEQRKELQEFAEHLNAKRRARRTGTEERT